MKAVLPSALLLLLPALAHADTFVSVEDVNSLLFYPERSAPATVVALNTSVLPAEIGAKLDEVKVNVGDRVKKGQVLARLDCRNAKYQLQMQQAQTEQVKGQLAFDEAEFMRGKRLAAQKNIGESDLDRRETQLSNAKAMLMSQQASLSMSQLNVENCDVKAPFNGVITQRIASVGSMVDFGKPVLEMVDTDTIEISAKIATDDLVSFKASGQYNLSALSSKHQLQLKSVVPVIEKNSRSQEARFTVKTASDKIVSGSTGRVTWTSPTPFLPAHLLQTRNGVSGYFILDNKVAKFVAVPDAQEGRPIPFEQRFTNDVIVDGRFGLHNGDAVTVVGTSNVSVAKRQSKNVTVENN